MDSLQFDKIHDALVQSTARNSRQLLSFVLIQLYLLITVAATTDLQLVLPDSKVTLPLLNVELPLFGFYIVAPALIVIFHFHYLINLLQHARKLKAWDEAKSDRQNVLLPGFILNFSILFKKITVNYRLLRFLQSAILCFFPLLLLLFIQIRFADYHSVSMTTWHFVLVFVDFLVLLIYWYRINYPELLDEKYDAFKILLSVFVIRWKKKDKDLRRPERVASRGYLWLFAMVQLVSLSCLLVVVLLSFNYFKESYPFIPRINVQGATLVKPPSDLIIQAYLLQGKSLDSAWLEHGQGIDLSRRDFQFASFDLADLRMVNLSSANLNGAILDHTQLNGASLRLADLNGASLWEADLNGADLGFAELNGAYLRAAELNDADLSYAELNGAYLGVAELNSADLGYAELNGANLNFAVLNGANLYSANLNGADLQLANLNGANLHSAWLNGADLSNARLIGADLSFAELNGAYLPYANLNGSDLAYTSLNGADLAYAELNGANLKQTKIRGCRDFWSSEHDGLYFETVDTIRIPNWDSLITAIEDLILEPFRKEKALNRLRIAQKDSSKIDPAISKLKPNFADFIEVRKNLSCQSRYVAKNMLSQLFVSDSLTAQLRDSIIYYMYRECPDTLAAIQPLLDEELSNRIDSILQSKPAK